jgi:predicted ArsR family transcriptional regulator
MSTATKFKALKILIDSKDGISAVDLAQALETHRQTAYRVISSISKDGFFQVWTKKDDDYQTAPAVFKIFINEKVSKGFKQFEQSHNGYYSSRKDSKKRIKQMLNAKRG